MTRWDSLTILIETVERQIKIERAAKRGTHGLEVVLINARTERMKLGHKIIKREKRAA